MKNETVGISPKLIVAVILAVLTYVLGQELLELPAWAVVAGQAVIIALGVYQASPGQVTTTRDPNLRAGERGLSLLEAIVVLLIAAVVVLLVVTLR